LRNALLVTVGVNEVTKGCPKRLGNKRLVSNS
jgi:hypothetical protein